MPLSFATRRCLHLLIWTALLGSRGVVGAALPVVADVEGQPLGANARRVVQALEFLGAPLPADVAEKVERAAQARDVRAVQELLDPFALVLVSLNPEVRVKVQRGPAPPVLQQTGFTPFLVKVLNDSTVTRRLRVASPQAGPVYAGASELILQRQAQTELNQGTDPQHSSERFLDVSMFQNPPMTTHLSGLEVEYAIVLISSSEAGRREATLAFDVGAGTQDIGFRGELPILFDVRPARPVTLRIRDFDGTPTAARLTFRDARGQVYPPQAKRLAPDFFFQPQIYRHDGETVLLPPGRFQLATCRGPEYRLQRREVVVANTDEPQEISVQLERWVNPMQYGFYCGDHHIHGAGCSHYDHPTQGVTPEDMFLQVKGEGLNVGCVLTWGPCFEFQRQYFAPIAHAVSEPLTILKYDLEISGFGSAALGHVCLLNLKDQTYPGSEGTKDKGWPTWTVPVMRWCKQQGGVTGYPHSAMQVDPPAATSRLLTQLDDDGDQQLTRDETDGQLLPDNFDAIDRDRNSVLTEPELRARLDRAADELPNYAIPEMNGAGAMEICVSTAEGVCDFISAMDTARISEWNTWYHLMNCGFPLKLSGETDFPCMSSLRVGQGRVYVQLGQVEQLDFTQWCEGIAQGRSYVSDGFAHALDLRVDGVAPGTEPVRLAKAGPVRVTAEVAFAPEVPKAVAYGQLTPAAGRRLVGDTVHLHAPRATDTVEGGERLVEIVVNGEVVATAPVPADGAIHELAFTVDIEQSSWVALRQFPQLHTNPVNVLVADRPIRASRRSAQWCAETIRLLWKNRQRMIAEHEREAARAAYDRAIARYQAIAAEAQAE